MENGWNLFSSSSSSRGHHGHFSAWDIWDLAAGTSHRFDWPSTTSPAAAAAASPPPNPNISNTLSLPSHSGTPAPEGLLLTHQHPPPPLYAAAGAHCHPDPHLVCLNLGKRHYFEEGDRHVAKRGRGCHASAAASAAVPRCQVEGCHVALADAKEYHRRHKVCEAHSKAPKVVVLGLEQRFCQQCSRFHAVAEFDEAKRSCRRRLAGHNERRRKGSHDSNITNPTRTSSSQGGALSLLSWKNSSWFPSDDLSSRCSAALRELKAESRAAILGRQLALDPRNIQALDDDIVNGPHPQLAPSSLLINSHQQMMLRDPHSSSWDRFTEGGGTHLTLDLMQAPSSAFGFLSVRGKATKDEEEEEEGEGGGGGGGGGCSSELWSSLAGTHHVV